MPGYDGTGPFGTGPIGGCCKLTLWDHFTRRPKPRRLAPRVVPVIREDQELRYLEEEQKVVKQELQEIDQRIKEIKDAKT